MIWWISGIIVALASFVYIMKIVNKRTCMLAFGQGVTDVGELSWNQVSSRYNSYLTPMMRPMDAFAYKKGLEYALLSPRNSGWMEMKKEFVDAYKSGAITNGGTLIRRSGAETALRTFRLSIPRDIEDRMHNNPDAPLLFSKFDEAANA